MKNKICISIIDLLLHGVNGTEFRVITGTQIILTPEQYSDVSSYVQLVGETEATPTIAPSPNLNSIPPVTPKQQSATYSNIKKLVDINGVYQPQALKMNLIAHRGFISHFPQNTLLAMQKALDNGADELECDVQLSKDNIPVLFHDGTLDNLIANAPQGKNTLRQLTLPEIKQLRFKSLQNSVFKDEPIPTFADVLHYAKSKGVVIYPEIKPNVTSQEATPIIQAVIDADMEHLTIFQSFDMQKLKRVRQLTQTAAVGFLTASANVDNALTELAEMGRGYLLIEYHTVLNNPVIAQKCREKGVNLGVWTCDNQTDATRLMVLGVTNIMSNVQLKGI